MKRNAILAWAVLCFTVATNAQRSHQRFEIVAAAGVASYAGDIGENQTRFFSDHIQKLGPALGLGVRMHITNHMALRGAFNYAVISGADSLSNLAERKQRNLSFKSPIMEGSLLLEVSIFNWRHLRGVSVNSTRGGNSNLYLFGGMAFFKFNPQAYLGDRWHELQPLGTEGQGIKPNTPKYSLTSSALVVGAGYRVLLGGRFSLGLETGLRKTNTDYLDDVSKEYWDNSQIEATYGSIAAQLADRGLTSEGLDRAPLPEGAQRGSAKVKDYYGFVQLTLAVKLGSGGQDIWRSGGKRFRTRNRCYSF